ncbi:MAG: hypothetical protein KGD65_15610 [Candidatus Lokiarchaeota archaeon]|nr:hypothetical protein [Candidatus Lokiarchaeota archaeon]
MEEKSYKIIYIIGLIFSSIIMLWVLIFGILILNITFLIFFWVIKFLSGFGLILGIANGFLLLMDKLSNKLKKKGTKFLIVVEVIIPLFLIGYAIYKIFSSYFQATAVTQEGLWFWIDNILYIYGIVSLLLNLYILPLASEQFQKAVELGKLSFWKKKAKKVARDIKKKYFSLRKEFARAQVQDQMTVKEILDIWRNKFAINFLLVLALGSLIFTPIAFICVMYWLHLYVFFRIQTRTWEKVILLVGMIWIGFVAVISPFLPLLNLQIYDTIDPHFWTVNLFYLIGILVATYIFIKKLLNLQGITITALKMKSKDKKISKLKEEKEELERQLKEKDSNI